MLLGKCHGRLDRHYLPKQDVNMNARPEFREIIIAKKIDHWLLVARHPSLAPGALPPEPGKTFGDCAPGILNS
jgi:hypothetical protein